MRYLTLHHNSFWFQIRVPASLRARYGLLVRVNLQTTERAHAQTLGLRLAAEWLTRFSQVAAGDEQTPVRDKGDPQVPGTTLLAGPEAPQPVQLPPGPSLFQAFEYWRDLTPGRPERTVMEFQSTADLFDQRVGKPVAALTRSDIVS